MLHVGPVDRLLILKRPPSGHSGIVFMYLSVPTKSRHVGVSVGIFLFFSAHCCLAPSIWRKTVMQAYFADVPRAAMTGNTNAPVAAVVHPTTTSQRAIRTCFRTPLLSLQPQTAAQTPAITRVLLQPNDCSGVLSCLPILRFSRNASYEPGPGPGTISL